MYVRGHVSDKEECQKKQLRVELITFELLVKPLSLTNFYHFLRLTAI